MNLEDILQKNLHLKNIHAGKRCFLLGNGPSLNTQDITLLKDEIVIVASSFFRHEHAKLVHPSYWVFADPLFWKEPEQFFVPAFKYALEKGINTRLFVPSGGFDYFVNVNRGPLIDLHFYHYDFSRDITTPIDFSQGIPPYGQNTMTVCLMLAFYLGCNPVYFTGCDRDYWNMTREDYETYAVRHFYTEPTSVQCNEVMPWEQWLRAKARTEWEYEQLKCYAALRGFDVYNATPGGQFNHYPRTDYESLFVHPIDLLERKKPQGYEADAMNLAQNAVKLMNEGADGSALELLEAALRRNLNTSKKIYGLEYLKALCLARLNSYPEALVSARQDRECNPANRKNTDVLIKQLENTCSVQTLIGL